MKIIYATGNYNKLEEVKRLFRNHKVEVEMLTLKDIGFNEEIDENGETFEENSYIKANAVKNFCNKKGINEIIIADDAGISVDALNGRPGVHSARYAGDHAPQEVTLAKLMNEMKNVPKEKRTAHFTCVLTAILKNGEIVTAKGITNGSISEKIGKLGGLTYCPVFIPEFSNKVMNEMSDKEKESTHREKAVKELIKKLNLK